MPGGNHTVTKEMGLDRAEFMRLLPRAVEGPYRVEGRTIVAGDGALSIHLGETSERRIANIVLPKTLVTIRFDGWNEARRRDALARFDKAYQRGGG